MSYFYHIALNYHPEMGKMCPIWHAWPSEAVVHADLAHVLRWDRILMEGPDEQHAGVGVNLGRSRKTNLCKKYSVSVWHLCTLG